MAAPASVTPADPRSTSRAGAPANVVVAVTSFGMNYNCNASGSYRLDQADDLAFINGISG